MGMEGMGCRGIVMRGRWRVGWCGIYLVFFPFSSSPFLPALPSPAFPKYSSLMEMVGLYPIVTQPVYLILSPWFNNLNISVAGNKTLKITTEGLIQGPYIQKLFVNGQTWNKSWVTHEDLIVGEGGNIHFVLGKEAMEWDVGDLPPSPGHLDLGVRN